MTGMTNVKKSAQGRSCEGACVDGALVQGGFSRRARAPGAVGAGAGAGVMNTGKVLQAELLPLFQSSPRWEGLFSRIAAIASRLLSRLDPAIRATSGHAARQIPARGRSLAVGSYPLAQPPSHGLE